MVRQFTSTFRQRVALLFVALALVVGLPTYWYIDRVYERHLIEHDGRQQRDLGNTVARVLARNLQERQREIMLLSKMPLYRRAPFDSPELKASIERVQDSYPDYSWIGLADREGVVRAATRNLLVGANVSDRPWFREGLARASVLGPHEAPMLGRILSEESSDGPLQLIDFSAPVLDQSGAVRGVLGFRAHRDWLSNVVNVLVPPDSVAQGLQVIVIGKDGTVIHPAGSRVTPGLPANPQSDQPFFLQTQDAETTYVTCIVPVPTESLSNPVGWRVVVRRPAELILADANALQRALVRLGTLAAVIFAALAWWLAGLLSRPIRQLSTVARRIEDGDESTSFAVRTSTYEVRELSDALRGMADTLLSRKRSLVESNQQVTERSAALERANEQLRRLSRRDSLTGLANRLAAEERLNEEFTRMKRTENCYAVLMMDIDFFKQVNDTYGHVAGDTVLRHIGRLLVSTVRESDFVARYGGEEFLAILPATDLENACLVADKIQLAVTSTPVPGVGVVTLSIGLALADATQADMDEAVGQADHWLYEAKRSGRNRVAGPGIRRDRDRLHVLTDRAGSDRA